MRRLVLAFVFLVSGCAGLARHINHVGEAVGAGLEAASLAVLGSIGGGLAVDAEVQVATEAAVPDSVYQTWIVSKQDCANARSYHVRCVRAQQGQACFFESDDGLAFDCVDRECRAVPPELSSWCAGA